MQYSIVSTKNLNDEFRLDSEYYKPDNLTSENIVKKHKYELLGNICKLIAGPFGSAVTTDKYDTNSSCRYIRGKDIQSFFIEQSDNVFIQESVFEELSQFHLQEKDILITVVGMNFGKVSIIYPEDSKAIFSCKSTLLRNANINTFFLAAYLSTEIGYKLIRRGQRGAAQPGINLFDIKNIPVPILSSTFQNAIENLISKGRLSIQDSNTIYTEVENLLLSELGLLDWKPKHSLSFVKNYSDTQQAGRCDAEYFQPKYDEIVEAIKSYASGWDTAENILNVKGRNFSPKEKVEYKYIELANIGNNGEITGFTEAEGKDLPTRARRKVSKDDVVVSSIEGSLSSIALISDKYDGALCSTGFYVVDSEKINPQTLLVLLKSPIGQEQLKKGCNGTILTAINKDEIGNIILPIVDSRIQNQIQQKVTESFNLRKQSKHLLECAKKAVEIAIEKNEETALHWLKSQIDNIGRDN